MRIEPDSPVQRGGHPDPTLLPFRGLRFATALPGGLAGVIGPPADIDSSDEARAYVHEREVNAVRLEIEDDGRLRFRTARSILDDWRRRGVFTTDDAPSYYVYDQTFDDHGVRRTRRGIFGLVPLDAPDVCVLPHEGTWEDNRARRLQLLRDLNASISPIFLIYEGAESRTVLESVTQRPADAEDADAYGNNHRLWCISDPAEVERIRQAMQGRSYYIADGHHRYEAARLFHAEAQREETGLILACCVEASDPGIVIRPIHRLLHTRDAASWQSAAANVEQHFDVDCEPVGERDGLTLLRSLPSIDLPVAGVITDGGETLLTLQLRSWDMLDLRASDDAGHPAQRLDVSVMTDALIHRALGIAPEQDESAISYVNDADEVLKDVRQGTAGIGILLRPVRLEQVLAVARAHGRVPAKSTSFVPKVPLGLVMHAFDGDRDA